MSFWTCRRSGNYYILYTDLVEGTAALTMLRKKLVWMDKARAVNIMSELSKLEWWPCSYRRGYYEEKLLAGIVAAKLAGRDIFMTLQGFETVEVVTKVRVRMGMWCESKLIEYVPPRNINPDMVPVGDLEVK